MKRYWVVFCILWVSLPVLAATAQLERVVNLPRSLHEISGMIWVNHRLWGIVDSRDTTVDEINPETGRVEHRLQLLGVKSLDWEAITHDAHWVYVGNIGNNYGNRKNLKIYRFPIKALSQHWVAVKPDIIHFYYPEQKSFQKKPYTHNFDAEALLAQKNALLLFTKNWADRFTVVYRLPKTPGNYAAKKIETLQAGALVTAATQDQHHIYLSAYNVVGRFRNATIVLNRHFPHVIVSRVYLPVGEQVESIAHVKNNLFYFAAEGRKHHPPQLFRVRLVR